MPPQFVFLVIATVSLFIQSINWCVSQFVSQFILILNVTVFPKIYNAGVSYIHVGLSYLSMNCIYKSGPTTVSRSIFEGCFFDILVLTM